MGGQSAVQQQPVVMGGEAAETVHPQSTTRKKELRIETLNQAIAFGTSVAEEHTQDVHSHPCCLPGSDFHCRISQGKHCQDEQNSTKPGVPTAAKEVRKYEANHHQQRGRMQVKLQGNPSMPSGHIPVHCLCILPHNAHQFPALSHFPPSNPVTRPSWLPLLLAE